MEKITVALSEEVVDWMNFQAAESGRNVSEWLACLLEEMMKCQEEYDAAMQAFLARKPKKLNWADGRKPTREELHEC